MDLMQRFVGSSAIRMAKYFGWVTVVIFLVAVLGFGASPMIFLPIGIGGLMLFAHLNDRADRIARERGLR
jgi:hypothetical protein